MLGYNLPELCEHGLSLCSIVDTSEEVVNSIFIFCVALWTIVVIDEMVLLSVTVEAT